MDYTVHGILQARILEWVAFPFSRYLAVMYTWLMGFPGSSVVKNLPAMQETWVQSFGWKNPLEKGKATHSTILAWRITWTV